MQCWLTAWKQPACSRQRAGSFFVPDDFHHGLMILIHTAVHLMHGGVGLRHLCDWAVFAAHFSEMEFRALFEERFRDAGLWEFACALTAVSVRYLSCPDPHWTGAQDPVFLQTLLFDILEGGNFGKKDRQRLNHAKLMVNRDVGTVSRGIGLRNLISAINKKASRTLPATNRSPVLLPLDWIAVGARHLLLVARGRKPGFQFNRIVEGAAQRSALYQQLRIFENAGDE